MDVWILVITIFAWFNMSITVIPGFTNLEQCEIAKVLLKNKYDKVLFTASTYDCIYQGKKYIWEKY